MSCSPSLDKLFLVSVPLSSSGRLIIFLLQQLKFVASSKAHNGFQKEDKHKIIMSRYILLVSKYQQLVGFL